MLFQIQPLSVGKIKTASGCFGVPCSVAPNIGQEFKEVVLLLCGVFDVFSQKSLGPFQ